MRYVLAVAILLSGLFGVFSTDVLAATDKQMGLDATVSMEQALKTAMDSVPGGKPYEVEMDKENGRITYKIALVDPSKKTYRVRIDAQNGQLLEKK